MAENTGWSKGKEKSEKKQEKKVREREFGLLW